MIELEQRLPYSEGQPISVFVELLPASERRGSPEAILRAMRELPKLAKEDVDELERMIEEGKLPVRP